MIVEYSRDQSLLDVAPNLFTSHHYHQLGGQLNQTATRVTLNSDRLREEKDGKDDLRFELRLNFQRYPYSILCSFQIWYLFIPQLAPLAKHISIIPRIADKLALEESHVEAGGVVVDELEEEHLHRQFVLILQVCLWDFCCTVKGNKT